MNRRSLLRAPLGATEAATPPTSPTAHVDLTPSTVPLGRPEAAHLLRRAHFGLDLARLDALVGQPAAEAAAALVQEAVDAPLPDPPDWIDDLPPGRDAAPEIQQAFLEQNRINLLAWNANWMARMQSYGLRERLTLFWHNHFVTELESYRLAPFAYRYLTTLRTHALGNFRDFVHAVGLDPAMLRYLNGVQNVAGAPNENYARELLELFTMGPEDPDGQPNYSQQDIEEIARALTGWVIDERSLSVAFVPERHDAGEKTIFGRTGAWGYDDVIDLLFAERRDEIAVFIAGKLYREFVYAEADAAVVADLAGVLLDADFALAPAVEVLLASEAFFDERVRGARIKSPVDLMIGQIVELDVSLPEPAYGFVGRMLEPLQQALLSPPNVAGWPGHHAWLNTTTLPARWNINEALGRASDRTDLFDLVAVAEQVHDPADPLAVFRLPTALAEHLIPVPLDRLDLPVGDAPFAGDLVNFPIPAEVLDGPAHVRDLAKLFLDGTPWYEWNLYDAVAQRRLTTFVRALQLVPEYQLT